ncbi:hypothetical protein COX84_03835, partial [Candidatus Micrarchaeota archaeon CG_4_10_14_0_2_um_filter_49_7]
VALATWALLMWLTGLMGRENRTVPNSVAVAEVKPAPVKPAPAAKKEITTPSAHQTSLEKALSYVRNSRVPEVRLLLQVLEELNWKIRMIDINTPRTDPQHKTICLQARSKPIIMALQLVHEAAHAVFPTDEYSLLEERIVDRLTINFFLSLMADALQACKLLELREGLPLLFTAAWDRVALINGFIYRILYFVGVLITRHRASRISFVLNSFKIRTITYRRFIQRLEKITGESVPERKKRATDYLVGIGQLLVVGCEFALGLVGLSGEFGILIQALGAIIVVEGALRTIEFVGSKLPTGEEVTSDKERGVSQTDTAQPAPAAAEQFAPAATGARRSIQLMEKFIEQYALRQGMNP